MLKAKIKKWIKIFQNVQRIKKRSNFKDAPSSFRKVELAKRVKAAS